MTTYNCVHPLCIQHFLDINSWKSHVLQHNNFWRGFICNKCHSFIKYSGDSDTVQVHNYLDHSVHFDNLNECRTATPVCPWKGSIWCSACEKTIDLGGIAQEGHITRQLVDHLASHLPRDKGILVNC
ncbi:hypothetical protein BDW69DRAFT_100841 [Aspergillus filifer]